MKKMYFVFLVVILASMPQVISAQKKDGVKEEKQSEINAIAGQHIKYSNTDKNAVTGTLKEGKVGNIAISELPEQIVSAFKKEYPNGKMTSAKLDGTGIYHIECKNGDKEFETYFSENGEPAH